MLLIDNIIGSHSHRGSGSTSDPVYRKSGTVASEAGVLYRYELETTDGKEAKFLLAGKPYDLTSGQVFLITVNGKEVTVKQLARDLSNLEPTLPGCEKFLLADSEIAEYLKQNSE